MGQYLWGPKSQEWIKQEGDNLTETSAKTIDFVHHEIHEGVSYSVSKLVASIADNSTYVGYVITGLKEMHTVTEFVLDGSFEGYFLESPSVSGTAYGVAVTPYNRRRVSSNTSSALFYAGSTLSSYGTTLVTNFVPGGTGPKSLGGIGSERTEWCLKTGTHYAWMVVNKAGTSKEGNFKVDFYERSV
jgi:hypothetical protein